MKKSHLIILILVLLPGSMLLSQTFEDYKKQKEQELSAFEQQQMEFINRMKSEFDEYVVQRDKEFTNYLKNQWQAYQVLAGQAPPDIPKPDVVPAYEEKPEREEAWNKIEAIAPVLKTDDTKPREIIVPQILKTDEESFDAANMSFDFFGFRIILDYDQNFRFDPPAAINPATISNFWESMSRTNYSGLVARLESYKAQMNLNDWGYYMLLQEFSETIYAGSPNGQNLMTWVLMNRSGYKAKVAYAGQNLSLLVPSENTVYSKSFLDYNGLHYYVMNDLGAEDIFTYDKDFPGANKTLDFSIKSPLNFNKNLVNKSIGFSYKDKPYSLNIGYNKNVIDFYENYPQVDINIYFDAAVSSETKETLLENLRPVVAEMSDPDAVGFLLKFVQTSFEYKTDQQQFSREKFFFPEEIIYYPYCDCEDRSVFFAYLVKELLSLKVIGLEYPGHIATAVNFKTDIEGDNLVYKGERYIVADPTFIGAPLGLTMPEYRNKEATIIELANATHTGRQYKTFWERANESGGFRGNNLKDIVFDDQENAYLTGYFVGEASFDNQLLKSPEDGNLRTAFVAKYDKNGNVVWANMITGTKSVTGFSLIIENNNDLYIAGSYSGTIDFNNGASRLQCNEEVNDVFIAKYNVAGRLIWAGKTGLDTYPQDNGLTYMTRFGKDGSNKGTSFFCEDENFKNFGLQFGPLGLIYLTGSFRSTSGFTTNKIDLVTNESNEFDLLESLKAESDNLIADDYEKHIAGLFAVLNHIKYNGIRISGQEAQQALDRYNPQFKSVYPGVYESIGLISFMVNDDGIVIMETNNGKSITIDKLKISNESKIKITSYSSGDSQIDVLSGIRVGKAFIWFDLNYVKLLKESGNLLFDYDTDHTQKTLNMKDDLLY